MSANIHYRFTISCRNAGCYLSYSLLNTCIFKHWYCSVWPSAVNSSYSVLTPITLWMCPLLLHHVSSSWTTFTDNNVTHKPAKSYLMPPQCVLSLVQHYWTTQLVWRPTYVSQISTSCRSSFLFAAENISACGTPDYVSGPSLNIRTYVTSPRLKMICTFSSSRCSFTENTFTRALLKIQKRIDG